MHPQATIRSFAALTAAAAIGEPTNPIPIPISEADAAATLAGTTPPDHPTLPSDMQIGDRAAFSVADQSISSTFGTVVGVHFAYGKVSYDLDFPELSHPIRDVDSSALIKWTFAEGRTHVAATETEPEKWV